MGQDPQDFIELVLLIIQGYPQLSSVLHSFNQLFHREIVFAFKNLWQRAGNLKIL